MDFFRWRTRAEGSTAARRTMISYTCVFPAARYVVHEQIGGLKNRMAGLALQLKHVRYPRPQAVSLARAAVRAPLAAQPSSLGELINWRMWRLGRWRVVEPAGEVVTQTWSFWNTMAAESVPRDLAEEQSARYLLRLQFADPQSCACARRSPACRAASRTAVLATRINDETPPPASCWRAVPTSLRITSSPSFPP